MNRLEKLAKLTDGDLRNIALKTGRSYLEVVRDVASLKRQAEYYKTDAYKEAQKRYRARRQERLNELKNLL